MTSRERVLAAVAHRQPDRVPVAAYFAPELAAKLRDHLGVDAAGLDEWTGQDVFNVAPRFPRPASELAYADPTIEVTGDGDYLDLWRVPFRPVGTGFQTYMELSGKPPLRSAETAAAIDEHPWPTAEAWDYSVVPARLAERVGRATLAHSRGAFEIACFLRGMGNFLTDVAIRPALAEWLLDHIVAYLLERSRRLLEAGGGRYVLFEYNDDVAGQQSLFLSPEMWRRLCRPRMAKFCELAREFGAKLRYHCCGAVRAILPDLIDLGVDILNPVQPLAAGMDPFELKREFGKYITFDGGVDIQHLMPTASADQVRDHVRRLIDEVGRDGGYFLGGSHVIQADVPVANVVAMIEEARRT